MKVEHVCLTNALHFTVTIQTYNYKYNNSFKEMIGCVFFYRFVEDQRQSDKAVSER